MIHCIFAILAILGTVLGSGFVSGKEIVVFFSQFGWCSFPAIAIVFVLFYYLTKKMLFGGEKIVKTLQKSRIAFALNLLLCIIFSSSMFAGVIDMTGGWNLTLSLAFLCILFLLCGFVSKRGISSLDRLNLFLVPFMIVVLCAMIGVLLAGGGKVALQSPAFGGASVFYAVLYTILNTSNSCLLYAKLGERLSAKQKTRVAFFSALVLAVMLTLVNIVLQKNPAVFGEDMPLLSLFGGAFGTVVSIAVMIGCLTTLFSLVYSCSSSMRGLCKNEFLIFGISVVLPFLLSFLGFGRIVAWLYPIASLVGLGVLLIVLFIPLFKRADKKIHSRRKHTK